MENLGTDYGFKDTGTANLLLCAFLDQENLPAQALPSVRHSVESLEWMLSH